MRVCLVSGGQNPLTTHPALRPTRVFNPSTSRTRHWSPMSLSRLLECRAPPSLSGTLLTTRPAIMCAPGFRECLCKDLEKQRALTRRLLGTIGLVEAPWCTVECRGGGCVQQSDGSVNLNPTNPRPTVCHDCRVLSVGVVV